MLLTLLYWDDDWEVQPLVGNRTNGGENPTNGRSRSRAYLAQA
jgi:hypothetical protein